MGGVEGGAADSEELRIALERLKSQGVNNLSEYQQKLIKWSRNVDKRYAWVILISLFFVLFSSAGTYRVYTIIFAKTTSEGIMTREEAFWPVSMIFTVENTIGPLVSIIAYQISSRQSMLVGSFLVAIGNGLSAFSNSLILDVLLIGFVQGIGYAFIFMPLMSVINSYFLKYRNSALGLALCGSTSAIFAMAPIFQWAVKAYPWRYSYLGLGIANTLSIFFVLFIKPNPKPKLIDFISDKTNAKKENSSSKRGSTLSRMSFRALTYHSSTRKQSTISIARRKTSSSMSHRQPSIISINPFASSVGLERKISRAIGGDQRGPRHLCPTNKQLGNIAQQQGMSEFSKAYEAMSLSEVAERQENEFKASTILEILKVPGFHLIWYSELVYFCVFSIYCLVLVDYGTDRDLTSDQAYSLLNYLSVGELIGRLVLPALVDINFISNKNVAVFLMLAQCALLVLIVYVDGIIWFASITVTLSALSSLLYILLNGLLVDYLGEGKVTLGYGMSSSIGGVLMLFRPQAVGYFRDNLETYDPLMIALGISCGIGGVLWLIEPLLVRLVGKEDCNKAPDNDRGCPA